uniref:Uncharacterized protein n=1 Tax=Fagus sylvatica TaxID=28930 RepID=A0A2N9ILX3_FAGSY
MSRRSGSQGHNSASSSSNTAAMDLYPVDDYFSLNQWAPHLAHEEDISILFRPEEHISHQQTGNDERGVRHLELGVCLFLAVVNLTGRGVRLLFALSCLEVTLTEVLQVYLGMDLGATSANLPNLLSLFSTAPLNTIEEVTWMVRAFLLYLIVDTTQYNWGGVALANLYAGFDSISREATTSFVDILGESTDKRAYSVAQFSRLFEGPGVHDFYLAERITRQLSDNEDLGYLCGFELHVLAMREHEDYDDKIVFGIAFPGHQATTVEVPRLTQQLIIMIMMMHLQLGEEKLLDADA